MSTAIFSDLHGKIGDLLRFLDQTGNCRRICLGDAVGKGDCNSCLRVIREQDIPCVVGNHEVDLIQLYDISEDYRSWLKTWPDKIFEDDTLYCHTWVSKEARRFEDLGSTFQAQEMFQAEDFKVAFVGHSHSPGWWTLTPERPVWQHAEVGTELKIEDSRLIVDVGSLGEPKQPEDARYVILEGRRVRWCGL